MIYFQRPRFTFALSIAARIAGVRYLYRGPPEPNSPPRRVGGGVTNPWSSARPDFSITIGALDFFFGVGVARGLGVVLGRGVAVARGRGVGVAVGRGVARGVAAGRGVGVARAPGVARGAAVGRGVAAGVARGAGVATGTSR